MRKRNFDKPSDSYLVARNYYHRTGRWLGEPFWLDLRSERKTTWTTRPTTQRQPCKSQWGKYLTYP